MRKTLLLLLTFTPFVTLALCQNDNPGALVHNLLNPDLGICTLPDIFYAAVNVLIKLLIPLVAVLIIWCGFEFATAQGNDKKIESAKQKLTWVIIGLLIIFGAKGMGLFLQSTINSLK